MDKGNCVVKFEFHYHICEFFAHSKELTVSFVTYQICAFEFSLHNLQKVKCAYEPVAHQAGAYPGFRSMKRLGVFLLPPGWDASPSQGYPQHLVRRYPFIHLDGERHCESKVSCPSTQQNVPGQGSNVDLSIRGRAH